MVQRVLRVFFPATSTITHSDMGGLRPVLVQFGETTSVKGVGRALKARQYTMRTMWIVAVVFGLSFALYNILTLLVRYFDYQTVSSLRLGWGLGESPRGGKG